MKTEVWSIEKDHIDPALIQQAGQIIKDGGLVAFPTETVYGLGANGLNESAAAKIYAAKGRPSDNPLIIHIAHMEELSRVAAVIPQKARMLAEAFWPGPLTMIFQKTEEVPFGTTGGLDTVAVRMPSHPVALALIEAGGGFIAAPSANTSGRPSPTKAAHVKEDLDGKIPLILDGGDVSIGLESTIVDMTGPVPMILRPGFITTQMIEKITGRVETDRGLLADDPQFRPKAPGMKYRHYAPKAEMTIVEGSRQAVIGEITRLTGQAVQSGKKVGILTVDEDRDCYPLGIVKCIGSWQEELQIAKSLYGALREFDQIGVDLIYSESFATEHLGQAIMNRLLKAAGHRLLQV